ncbi:MAG: gene transfer agent family protein [Pseudomonadota bacterium]
MVNRYRGEVRARLDGRDYTLCLTLGALAELEDAFGVDDIASLTERFATGRLKARDMTRVIGAGLRGAGFTFTDEEVGEMQVEDGAVGYANLVAELLTVTFAGPGASERSPS